jgi:hypothetical protein
MWFEEQPPLRGITRRGGGDFLRACEGTSAGEFPRP